MKSAFQVQQHRRSAASQVNSDDDPPAFASSSFPIAWGTEESCRAPAKLESVHDADVNNGEENEDDSPCFACMERAPDTILIECGHGGLCSGCAIRLWREGPARRRCPLCRQRFAGVVKILTVAGNKVLLPVSHYTHCRIVQILKEIYLLSNFMTSPSHKSDQGFLRLLTPLPIAQPQRPRRATLSP